MFYLPIITLNIKSPIRLAIVAFYKNDYIVNRFLSCFSSSLRAKDIIVIEEKFNEISKLISFLSSLRSRNSYNCLMLVTHGTTGQGHPTFEETEVTPSPFDELVENWTFLSASLYDTGVDSLGILAICYSGDYRFINLLTRGQAQFLHIITPFPNKPLEVKAGAESIALFINILFDMNKKEYTPEDLKLAEKEVNKRYPKVIKLWLFGEV